MIRCRAKVAFNKNRGTFALGWKAENMDII